MLAAFLLRDLYQGACALPFWQGVSQLESTHQLMRGQLDLREFAAALAKIVSVQHDPACEETLGQVIARADAPACLAEGAATMKRFCDYLAA